METVSASITFYQDVLRLWAEPLISTWIVDPIDDAAEACLFLEVDDPEALEPRETGRIAGVEIVGFLEFDAWAALPELQMLWQHGRWEPLPLGVLLQRLQTELRARATTATPDLRRAAS